MSHFRLSNDKWHFRSLFCNTVNGNICIILTVNEDATLLLDWIFRGNKHPTISKVGSTRVLDKCNTWMTLFCHHPCGEGGIDLIGINCSINTELEMEKDRLPLVGQVTIYLILPIRCQLLQATCFVHLFEMIFSFFGTTFDFGFPTISTTRQSKMAFPRGGFCSFKFCA